MAWTTTPALALLYIPPQAPLEATPGGSNMVKIDETWISFRFARPVFDLVCCALPLEGDISALSWQNCPLRTHIY